MTTEYRMCPLPSGEASRPAVSLSRVDMPAGSIRRINKGMPHRSVPGATLHIRIKAKGDLLNPSSHKIPLQIQISAEVRPGATPRPAGFEKSSRLHSEQPRKPSGRLGTGLPGTVAPTPAPMRDAVKMTRSTPTLCFFSCVFARISRREKA
jgi:hypothetical protein